MSLIEIFFFFFPSPREKAVAEFVSWEISVSVSNLEDEWNNQLKKKRKKKKLPKVARSPWEAERSFHPAPGQLLAPGKRPRTDGLCAGMDQTLSQTVSPTIHPC